MRKEEASNIRKKVEWRDYLYVPFNRQSERFTNYPNKTWSTDQKDRM